MAKSDLIKEKAKLNIQKTLLDKDLANKIHQYQDVLGELLKQEGVLDSKIRVKPSFNGAPPYGLNVAGICPICNKAATPGLCQCNKLPIFQEVLAKTAPPGREEQVKTLKPKVGKESAFKIAWASYNKSHKKNEEHNDAVGSIAEVESAAAQSGQDPSKIPPGVKMQAAKAVFEAKQKGAQDKSKKIGSEEKTPVKKAEESRVAKADMSRADGDVHEWATKQLGAGKAIVHPSGVGVRPIQHAGKTLYRVHATSKMTNAQQAMHLPSPVDHTTSERAISHAVSVAAGMAQGTQDKSKKIGSEEKTPVKKVEESRVAKADKRKEMKKGENYDNNNGKTVMSRADGVVPKQKAVNPKTVPNAVAEKKVSNNYDKASGHTFAKPKLSNKIKKDESAFGLNEEKNKIRKNMSPVLNKAVMKPEWKKQIKLDAQQGAFEAAAKQGKVSPALPPKPKMPSQQEHADRAVSLQEFMPKGKFSKNQKK